MIKTVSMKKEDAVSPVIGVMLMIVVTIIIAAFVAAFAGGMFSATSTPPQVSIGVKITYNGGYDGNQCVMTIENKGGDSVPSSDLKIVTYYTSLTGSNKGTIRTETIATSATATTLTDETETKVKVVLPILSDASYGSLSNDKLNFGNYVFAPGTIMSTYNNFGTGKVIMGQTSEANAKKYLNKGTTTGVTDFGIGSAVTVQIIHTPTGTVLFDKEVMVS